MQKCLSLVFSNAEEKTGKMKLIIVKSCSAWAGEIAQLLRSVQANLPKDQGSILRTHMACHKDRNFSLKDSDGLFWP